MNRTKEIIKLLELKRKTIDDYRRRYFEQYEKWRTSYLEKMEQEFKQMLQAIEEEISKLGERND